MATKNVSNTLNGWKEISQYLGRGLRTVQRWEVLFGLPVHRPSGKDRSAVFALKPELDQWLSTSWKRTAGEDESDPQIIKFRIQQLEEEAQRLRRALKKISGKGKSDARPTTVMAVDDNDAFRYAITRVVERGGHRPVAAANGEEALRLAKLQQPDLILLDVNMPDLQGYEVCRRLKNDRATAHIPVVFLSATAKSQSAIEECIKAGGESFLFSPVEPDQLLAVVHAALVKQGRVGAPSA